MGNLPKVGSLTASLHNSMLQDLFGSNSITISVLRNYKRSFNGFVVELTEDEARKIAVPKGRLKGANLSLTVTDSRARHISGKTQIRTKGLVSPRGHQQGELGIDEPLIRAMVQFWNPGYSCFTFNWEDMVPTIEEYTTLLHYENIKLGRVYVKHTKSQPFKSTLARDATIRDFLDQVQKAAHHLHGLAREAGVVRQGIQPVTDEGRRLVNLLEAIQGLDDLIRVYL
ncbi:hypothetical protein F3Y22_tig00117027pilonHSYRG00036 [Hibiscus syriacus]|uniref:Uncharacterized protein n=1 Tax=Hibiscus syriacus TaxID=106335 RepID=A0A6A2WBP6_HIBSY|nr:hypothetical protein F3Y22_tig00117027pilonHSYRG00036 [Hibiscus syriacus]